MAANALLLKLLMLLLIMLLSAYSLPTTTSDDDTQGPSVVGFNPEMVGLLMAAKQHGEQDVTAHAQKRDVTTTLAHVDRTGKSVSKVKKKGAVTKRSIVKVKHNSKAKKVAKRSVLREGKKSRKPSKKKRSVHEKKQKKIMKKSANHQNLKKKKKEKKKKRAIKTTKKRKRNAKERLFEQPRGDTTIAANEIDGYRNRNEVPVELLFQHFLDTKRDVIPQPPDQEFLMESFQNAFQKRNEIPHEFQEVAPFHAVWSELPDSVLQKRSEIPTNETPGSDIVGTRSNIPTQASLEKRQTPSEIPISGNVFETIPGNTPLSYLALLEQTQQQQNVKRDEIARPDKSEHAQSSVDAVKEESPKKDEIVSPEGSPGAIPNSLPSKKDDIQSDGQFQGMTSSEDEYHEPPVKKGIIVPSSEPAPAPVQPLPQPDVTLSGVESSESTLRSTLGLPANPESSKSMNLESSGLQALSETPRTPTITETQKSVMEESPNTLLHESSSAGVKESEATKKDEVAKDSSSSISSGMIRSLLSGKTKQDVVSLLSAMSLADLEEVQKTGGLLPLEMPQLPLKAPESSKRDKIDLPSSSADVFPSSSADVLQNGPLPTVTQGVKKDEFPLNIFPSLDEPDALSSQQEKKSVTPGAPSPIFMGTFPGSPMEFSSMNSGFAQDYGPVKKGNLEIEISNEKSTTPQEGGRMGQSNALQQGPAIDYTPIKKGNLEIEVSNEKTTTRESGKLSGSNSIVLPFPGLFEGIRKEAVDNITVPFTSPSSSATADKTKSVTNSAVENPPAANATADSTPDSSTANTNNVSQPNVENATQVADNMDIAPINTTSENTALANTTETTVDPTTKTSVNSTASGKKSDELPATEDGLLQLTNKILTDMPGFEENVGNLKEASVSRHGDDVEFQVHLGKNTDKRNKIRERGGKEKKENPTSSKNKLEDYLVSKFMSYVCGGEC